MRSALQARARVSLTVLPVAVVGIAVVAFQLALPRAAGIAMFTGNLAHQAQGAMLFVLGLHNVGRALLMTVWPWPIVPNHGYAAVELQMDALAPEAIVGGILLATGLLVGIWAIKRRRLGWVAALSFLYAPALLQSHWAVRLITDLAERLLYPSILGISMLVAGVILHLAKKPAARVGILTASALVFLAGSYSSRRAWTDDDALWIYAVRVDPRAALPSPQRLEHALPPRRRG